MTSTSFGVCSPQRSSRAAPHSEGRGGRLASPVQVLSPAHLFCCSLVLAQCVAGTPGVQAKQPPGRRPSSSPSEGQRPGDRARRRVIHPSILIHRRPNGPTVPSLARLSLPLVRGRPSRVTGRTTSAPVIRTVFPRVARPTNERRGPHLLSRLSRERSLSAVLAAMNTMPTMIPTTYTAIEMSLMMPTNLQNDFWASRRPPTAARRGSSIEP